MSDTAKTEQNKISPWVASSLALSMLLSSLAVSSPNTALPSLAVAFAAPFQHVQWIILAYLLTITIMIVSAGRLGDVLGHKRVLLAGIALFTVASMLCGLASGLWLLIAARALQGLGAAVLMALTVALVRETIPKEKTGRAMGLLGTMSAVGTALGPSLGGLLVAGPGWRGIFLIMVPLGLLNYFLVLRSLPTAAPITLTSDKQQAKPHGKIIDLPGTLLLGLTLAAYTLAVTTGGKHFGPLNLFLLCAAVLGAGLFIYVQTRVAAPLIQLRAFRDPVISASLAMNLLVSTVMMATLVVGPFYLSRGLGLNAVLVGSIMSIGPVISMLSGVPAGRLVDGLGAGMIILIGLLAMATGSFALAMLPALAGITGYIIAIAILTPGYQLFQAANNTAVMMNVAAEQRGVISGMLSLSRNLGLITGASVMGTVFAYASGSSDLANASAQAQTQGMRITFMLAAGFSLAALGIALASRRATPAALLAAGE